MPQTTTVKRSPEIQAARNTLRGRGWTIASVARHLGITREHLSLVLNGRRQSRRILSAIQELPENPTNPA
jgi:transcriptional regulator with XRE-family HTH domain